MDFIYGILHQIVYLVKRGLRTYDALESINGISLSTYNNDKITKTNFDRIVQELPCDITLVVKRRFWIMRTNKKKTKNRWIKKKKNIPK